MCDVVLCDLTQLADMFICSGCKVLQMAPSSVEPGDGRRLLVLGPDIDRAALLGRGFSSVVAFGAENIGVDELCRMLGIENEHQRTIIEMIAKRREVADFDNFCAGLILHGAKAAGENWTDVLAGKLPIDMIQMMGQVATQQSNNLAAARVEAAGRVGILADGKKYQFATIPVIDLMSETFAQALGRVGKLAEDGGICHGFILYEKKQLLDEEKIKNGYLVRLYKASADVAEKVITARNAGLNLRTFMDDLFKLPRQISADSDADHVIMWLSNSSIGTLIPELAI
jgi:hypothetical protein